MSLIDRFGREITYLRISVTDRCNLRCIYCMPETGIKFVPHEEILRFKEIIRIAEIFVEEGVKKIRLTGGEPLVRKGVVELVKMLSESVGKKAELTMTTNGTLLWKYGKELYNAGMERINIGIDTLNPEIFKKITRRDHFNDVQKSLDAIKKIPFRKIKLNVVVMKGINDAEIQDFVKLTLDNPWEVRFIEYMPFGNVTLETREKYLLDGETIIKEIGKSFEIKELPSNGVAKKFKVENAEGEWGIITPMTAHFCENCNRMRLTSNGFLRPCLFSREMVDIKTPIRKGADRETLLKIIKGAIDKKPRINPLLENKETSMPCPMNYLGG